MFFYCVGFVCWFGLVFLKKFILTGLLPLLVSPKDRKEHYKDLWRNGVEFGRLENADRAADLVGL